MAAVAADRNPYRILGVPRFATRQELSEAYRRLARRFHPDVNPHQDAARRMQEINWAYGVLRDPASRHAFDELERRSARRRASTTRAYSERSGPADPGNPGYQFLGGTADRAIVGSLMAVGALALSMLIGLEFVNWGAPIALAIGCWIGSVPNPRLSSQHGLAIGALIGLFSAASFSASFSEPNPSAHLVSGFVCCAPFTILLGGSLGAMAGSLAGWIRRAQLLVRAGH